MVGIGSCLPSMITRLEWNRGSCFGRVTKIGKKWATVTGAADRSWKVRVDTAPMGSDVAFAEADCPKEWK